MTARTTVVTGGSRGIGAAVCRRLAADGHDVVVTYVRDRAAAESVAADVEAAGRRALVCRVDTTDEESVIAMYGEVADFGTLTGLVTNAGAASAVGDLVDNDLSDIRADIDLNLVGVLACIKYAIAPMTHSGGSIVNISSAAATLGSPGMYVHYAASKAGVDALTVGLAKELADRNIRVNAVAPGTIWTDFHRDPNRPAKVARSVPMKRAGTPDEIAGAVSWLLSDDASYATGTTIRIAGGQ
ncbi:MAG: SDR family NAD(P)-dependent oxidoreductase [Rhodococcus fascians]|uniref:SDR family NAD(P)-dependent oxidoreductase n=1 Tax=Nocardiaceae TaxID=85025 RepID=UPI0003687B5D|nr:MULTISPECIES: SDR family NAD(P)-dependent oxidoreductase [Rhodococcus]OZD12712.1 SDR family oxidoreductase [Rhodococcus sp. 06-156-4C]OZD24334.1 SDR family oxidoreductase [Rhodococcus sp. 06-156-3C]OZD27444.1 SDR family oxidoreductase [Rhodococcus sp. 06-156-4a]OZD37208.1 SDR family oxidoreductase [Rhodococcus sp. 06-156-3b]OZD41141.1 SDR family oxidoreductase [Rhodococcus sp. 06-156-3]